MKNIIGGISFLFIAQFFGSPVLADGIEHIKRHNVSWDKPTVGAYDTMPLGNGSMGMTVAVTNDGTLHLTPVHTDAWSEAHRLLKLGKIEITFSPNPFVEDFQQTLEIDKGILIIKGKNGFHTELRVDANSPIFYLDANANNEFTMSAELSVWRRENMLGSRRIKSSKNFDGVPGGVLESGDVVLQDLPDAVAWYHRNKATHLRRETFKLHEIGPLLFSEPDILVNRTFGGWLTGVGMTSDGAQRLTSKPSKKQHLQLHVLSSATPTEQDWIDQIKQAALTSNAPDARQKHLQWWAKFWSRSWIDLSGDDQAETVARGYAHVMYLNALAGRGVMPLQWNGSIFSPDPRNFVTVTHSGNVGQESDPDWRNWSNLMLNQNIRLPYYSMLAAGQAEFTLPYINMYTRGLPLMRAHTQAVFNHEGTFFREAMTLWGISSPGMYGFDRSGLKPGQQKGEWHRTQWQGGLETAFFMSEYFEFTEDEAFAKNVLIPFADEIVRFFDLHWPHKDNKLYFPHVYALETFRDVDNPMPLVAGLHAVIQRLLNLPEQLTNTAMRTYWRALQKRLPDIPTRQYQGKTILANGEIVRGKKYNVELPELYAVFPYHLYGVGLPDLGVAQDTWNNRTVVVDDVGGSNPEWSRDFLRGGWRQESIMAAMTGLTEVARDEVSWAFGRTVPGMRYPGYFGTTYDWVPDVQHGGVAATALQRMLLQEVGHQLILVPAWPRNWDANFKLHAKNNTIVEGVVENGELVKLNVIPEERLKDVVVGKELVRWHH